MILYKDNPDSVLLCKNYLLNNEVVVIPCDTIYGLSSLYIDGFEKLKSLKGRDANKPFLVLATLEQAKRICPYIPEDIINLWPAPLTVILQTCNNEKLGIRVPDDPWLQNLLVKVGKPIYSTSVNISGEPSLLNFKDICNQFEQKVGCCVKGFDIQGTTPSTLIDATERPYKLLRQGVFDVSGLF